ncbi:MAG: membrane protein insertion efficiency factor YidD [Clostridiales bacterium]|jgi:putative membrane protein insertion efficiency factor|nr:membrane protein insertion efficiency factor YidD [Clostridiales bacterium]
MRRAVRKFPNTEYYTGQLGASGGDAPARPKFFWGNAAAWISVSLARAACLSAAVYGAAGLFGLSGGGAVAAAWIAAAVSAASALLSGVPRLLVFLIKVYQLRAPESLRSSCRFTPSCSVYAILALEKYFFPVALFKIGKRLLRCAPPNGGVDFP